MTGRHVSRNLVVAIALLAVVASATRAWAIVVVDSKTGLFGVTAGQTIRTSILNAATKGGINPCVGIFDVFGNMIAAVETDTRLQPGEGTFVDFDAARLGVREGQRMQIRAVVELETQPPDPQQPPDPTTPPDPNRGARPRPDGVILTLEVFDNATGRTAFTMPWVLAGFNPQPEPPAR